MYYHPLRYRRQASTPVQLNKGKAVGFAWSDYADYYNEDMEELLVDRERPELRAKLQRAIRGT